VDLAPLLVTTVAPSVAAARYVRALYGDRVGQVVYIGECPAASAEEFDAHLHPRDFLKTLEAHGIDPQAQPTVFDAVLPPDRRRFWSLPGGCPSPEMLWQRGHERALVTIAGDDLAIELAQRLLARQSVLVDLTAALGCACSGVTRSTPGRSAQIAVMSLEPPRAATPVVDPTIIGPLDAPLDATPNNPTWHAVATQETRGAARSSVQPPEQARAKATRSIESTSHLPPSPLSEVPQRPGAPRALSASLPSSAQAKEVSTAGPALSSVSGPPPRHETKAVVDVHAESVVAIVPTSEASYEVTTEVAVRGALDRPALEHAHSLVMPVRAEPRRRVRSLRSSRFPAVRAMMPSVREKLPRAYLPRRPHVDVTVTPVAVVTTIAEAALPSESPVPGVLAEHPAAGVEEVRLEAPAPAQMPAREAPPGAGATPAQRPADAGSSRVAPARVVAPPAPAELRRGATPRRPAHPRPTAEEGGEAALTVALRVLLLVLTLLLALGIGYELMAR
jgi:hypothetical protein